MKLRQELTLRKIGKDYIIVDPGQDKVDLSRVYTLNETAAWLWEKLQHRDFSKAEMIRLLLDEYTVSREQATHDVEKVITLFQEQHLLER